MFFAVHLRRKPLAKDIDCAKLAAQTEGFSGADIAAVARKSAMTAVRRAVKGMEKGNGKAKDVEVEPKIVIQRQDIEDALAEVRRR